LEYAAPTELADFWDGCSINMPRLRRWFADDRPANPAAGFVKDAAHVAPSPWGEGRVEGGREPFEIRIPHWQLVAPTRHSGALRRRKSDEGGRELFS